MTDLMRDSLDHCVKCTICESFCPVSAATPLFPGPKFVGPQGERYRDGAPSPDASLDWCSSCGICTYVCPQGVKIAEINSQAKAALKQERGVPFRDRVIARPTLSGRAGTPVAPIANRMLRSRLTRRLMERTLGIHRNAPMPVFSGRTLRGWIRRRGPSSGQRTIVYFHGCAANYYEVETGRMTVEVLEHNGFRVITPPQGCCGLPLQSNGLYDDARSYVRKLAAKLAPYARDGHRIVASSTSCGLMLKREAREILGVDDEDLRVVSAQTVDICELLLELYDQGQLRTDFQRIAMTVPYHAPCQLRGHGIGTPAVELMRLIPGVDVVESETVCCGVAGTYGLKAEKYEVAMQVGRELFAMVRDMQPEVAVCDSETCRWQITHATGIPSVHPIALLHRAYGLGVIAAGGGRTSVDG
jgi:glycerol-3-phosphate dehydrogenase subunit C